MLWGNNPKKLDAFISLLDSRVGKLLDKEDCGITEVPVITSILNACNATFGGAFPAFSKLDKEMVLILIDLFRNEISEDRGKTDAIVGLNEIMKGLVTVEEAVNWYCIFSFAAAFFSFSKLASKK